MADGHVPSHGFQVSIGMLMSTALYQQLLNEDIAALDVEKCVTAWPTLTEAQSKAREMFKDSDFPTIGETEITAKYIDHNALRTQLNLFKENWTDIRHRLATQIIPYEEAKARLAEVGAPTEPEQIGISRERFATVFCVHNTYADGSLYLTLQCAHAFSTNGLTAYLPESRQYYTKGCPPANLRRDNSGYFPYDIAQLYVGQA